MFVTMGDQTFHLKEPYIQGVHINNSCETGEVRSLDGSVGCMLKSNLYTFEISGIALEGVEIVDSDSVKPTLLQEATIGELLKEVEAKLGKRKKKRKKRK